MSQSEKIQFTDRDDLLKKMVFKKSEVNKDNAVAGLQKALKRVKRGDRDAMKLVLKHRKRMLSAAALVYIEIEEDEQYNAVVAEISVIDQIDLED
jgi:hypothetical protein